MQFKFPEYKQLDLSRINKEILSVWEKENTFGKSIEIRNDNPPYIFYEGPPSANGMPGIHHVISRTLKDIICRYKTLKGFLVKRKAGWDTHGLPVELSVETSLGITKEDIGKKISVKKYNDTCRQEVMKYKKEWEELTRIMGYWVDMDDPYITYENKYIETLWYLLKEFHKKDLLYKGYTIQPYSPAAGTGLSSHELNQPGCYRDVKDTTCVAQFKVIRDKTSEFLYENTDCEVYFMAWTTTPWTLPSNVALAVGKNINYVKVRTFNPYSSEPVVVILARDLLHVYFSQENEKIPLDEYEAGDKHIPYKILDEYSGKLLENIRYEQLINWVKPKKEAFKILLGDFVTTEDGTGIVHIAPTFGADDYRVALQYDMPSLIVVTKEGITMPLVDRQGKFYRIDDLDEAFVSNYVNVETYTEFAGRYVKNEYDSSIPPDTPAIDVDIAVSLKKENKAFRIEKHIHNYPHCWRTDKPVLYYPLDSWFIRTTAMKENLIRHNDTINWKPESTGTGRFGKWLENLVDWNLSRSRFWGTPLPIWMTEDKKEIKCIGSVSELKQEIDLAVKAGYMSSNPLKNYKEDDYSSENYKGFDLHRPFVDEIILVSGSGRKMFRELDLIDVWFDSGAMPYAQFHYPFSKNDMAFKKVFPADFIAEGVDQTRGWFFTLHAIAVMLFDSVSFKNIISNGLVLDKNGNKMSKRLGNAVDPMETIEKYGSDPLRWYMITNAQPWDNLKFDIDGIEEVKRKFFGTLYNTYSFFALYANVDGFNYSQPEVPVEKRPEIDRWIISLLNSLIKEVDEHYDNYEPTKAGRAIHEFVIENLSNWYVRLNRKRFWGGSFDEDKLAAYQTLYTCLEKLSIIASPIAPFYCEKIFRDLQHVTNKNKNVSVHLTGFPACDSSLIDKDLEQRMDVAQKISSMVLGLRRKVNIKVRQPLSKIVIPAIDATFERQLEAVEPIIKSEVNIKEIELLKDSAGILIKKVKPDFKVLGPRFGKLMKQVAAALNQLDQEKIEELEKNAQLSLPVDNQEIMITLDDVEIISEDIPGWLVSNEGKYTVALDITVTDELREEGVARELVNRIQNLRKESGLEVTDKINIELLTHKNIENAVKTYSNYISAQTLAQNIQLVNTLSESDGVKVELDETTTTLIRIAKI